MNTSKHLVSILAASAIVSAVGIAYAQTSTSPSQTTAPSTTDTTPAQPSTTPASPSRDTGMTPATRSDSTGGSSTEPMPRADRN